MLVKQMVLPVASMQRIVAAILVAALALPAFASGTQNSSSNSSNNQKSAGGSRLDGQVLGSDGKPIRGAVVVVRALEGDKSWASEPSDRRGRFYLQGLPYGWADLIVTTEKGDFLGDQAVNLPPGSRVVVNFNLLETADKPASWWTDRRVEPPTGISVTDVAGMAQGSQKLTGVEYWKSPAGIAILVSVAAVALVAIASGGGTYKAP
jgi:hypothetical protein